MSLPLLHAGRTNPGLSAALDLRFALDKSLTAYRGPTPSFSRASTGSYFDGSGVLRYAAVNILTYSEDFTNAAWVNQNTTDSGNATISPDGKTTADSLIESATNSSHLIYQQANATSGSIYTFSVYLKANQRSFAYIQMADSSSPNKRFSALINISNGTIIATRSLNSPTNTSSSISDAGNGWYRASITMSQSGGSIIYAQVAISDSSTPTYDAADLPTYSGNISNGIFIWGAQLEASSTVGTYCPTTSSANSAPRFNHTFNGTSWVSRGLLVEEQRTNLVTNSSDFTSTWVDSNVARITSSGTAPDGTNTAVKMYPTSSTTMTRIYRSAAYSCISVFAKAAEKSIVYFYDLTGVNVCWFDLSNGAIGTNNTGLTASMINCSNGWFRCSLASTSSSFLFFQIGVSDANGSLSSTASGTNGILIWGAQGESGAFPTSYIPATTATTRSADVCQITGGDFSGFWNGTEGSIAVDFDRIGLDGYQMPFRVNAPSSALYYYSFSGNEFYQIFGASTALTISGVSAANTTVKAAIAFKSNDTVLSRNGAAVLSPSSMGALPTNFDSINIGRETSGSYLNGHIARLRYYRKRLPNATLQQLST